MFLVRALLAVALLVAAQAASADGKIYASDISPEVPDQRALIVFDGKRQVMLIESRVALPDGRPTTALGWVVPVPDIPDIAVVSSDASLRDMYHSLRRRTDPQTYPVAPLVLVVAIVCLVIGYVANGDRPDIRTMRSAAWLGVIGAVLALVSLTEYSTSSAPSGVEVVKSMQVGPLDAKVVRATSGSELVDWLKSNGFSYGKDDVAAIDAYLRRKWVFVVAKLSPKPGTAFAGASRSPPLVLGFPTKEAVYPVSLTAAAGTSLDLVLYVFAPERVQSSAPLKIVFAGSSRDPVGYLRLYEQNKEAVALFSALAPGERYLTKFEGKLTPPEMREDIRLVRSGISGGYRELTSGPIFNFWVGGAVIVGFAAFLLQLAGRGRWRCNGFAWFGISMCMSPVALAGLLGSVGQQWWNSRKASKPAS